MALINTPWDGADSSEHWSDQTTEWDTVVMGGEVLPGIATVTGLVSRKLDVKQSAGSSGATLTDLGLEPARFEVMVTLWTSEHLRDWENVLPYVFPSYGKTPRAVDVIHPALTLAGIRRAYVESTGVLQQGQTPGTWECRISCVEWRPTTPVGVHTPTSSKSKGKLTDVPTVVVTPSESGAAEP